MKSIIIFIHKIWQNLTYASELLLMNNSPSRKQPAQNLSLKLDNKNSNRAQQILDI